MPLFSQGMGPLRIRMAVLCLNITNFRQMNLAAGDTILWTVQTTLLGFTSLLPLRAKYKKIAQD